MQIDKPEDTKHSKLTRDLLRRIQVLIVPVPHRVGTDQPTVLGIANVAVDRISIFLKAAFRWD
jgi:hypothetical protein